MNNRKTCKNRGRFLLLSYRHRAGAPRCSGLSCPGLFCFGLLCFGLLLPPVLGAQRRVDETALQRAREETEVILDLGRLIGFVHRMTRESPELDLGFDQAREMVEILDEIRGTRRMTPTQARRAMERIEDTILTHAQLAYTDRLWINAQRDAQRNTQNSRGESASSGTGTGTGTASRAGDGSGSSSRQGTGADASAPAGSLASYASGGAYNPMAEAGRRQAEELTALYDHLLTRLAR